uniref:Putative RNA-directed DNA polymerase from transposon BS n=1 Tax=Lygus hesperus TaxID=30085 RepID=A0A0A9XTL9_LYGHE
MVLLDCSNAFGTLCFNKLLSKLSTHFSFSSSAVKFIASYLSGRSQSVQAGTDVSPSLPLHSGVPQGSILGPLFFSLHINGISSSIKVSRCHQYADDTQIYLTCFPNNILQSVDNINNDPKSLSIFLATTPLNSTRHWPRAL